MNKCLLNNKNQRESTCVQRNSIRTPRELLGNSTQRTVQHQVNKHDSTKLLDSNRQDSTTIIQGHLNHTTNHAKFRDQKKDHLIAAIKICIPSSMSFEVDLAI